MARQPPQAPKWRPEPDSQPLRWEMFDVDMINLKSMMKVNVIKGMKEAINNKSTMCKGEALLKEFCRQPGQVIDRWFHCGPDDWSSDDGPGKGRGMVHFQLQYFPLENLDPMMGTHGALFVRVRQGVDFPQMDPGVPNSCNAYYEAKIEKLDKKKSTARPNTLTPDWSWDLKEFYNVPNEEILKVKFYSQNALTADQDIGRVQINIASIRESSYRGQAGSSCKEYELEDADSGRVTIECLFVPYF